MKHINGCILVIFFCSMFLLQIWVAQAQSNINVKEMKPAVVRGTYKIIHDPTVIDQRFPSLKKSNNQPINNTSLKVVKEVKNEKAEDKDVVWYKPWTWFK